MSVIKHDLWGFPLVVAAPFNSGRRSRVESGSGVVDDDNALLANDISLDKLVVHSRRVRGGEILK